MLTSMVVEGSTGPRFWAVETYLGVVFATNCPVAALSGKAAQAIRPRTVPYRRGVSNRPQLPFCSNFSSFWLVMSSPQWQGKEQQDIQAGQLRTCRTKFLSKYVWVDGGSTDGVFSLPPQSRLLSTESRVPPPDRNS